MQINCISSFFCNVLSCIIELEDYIKTLYPTNTPRGFHVETTWKRQKA